MKCREVLVPRLVSILFGASALFSASSATAADLKLQPATFAVKSNITVDSGISSYAFFITNNSVSGTSGTDYEVLLGTDKNDSVNMSSGYFKYVDTGVGQDQVAVYYSAGHTVNTGEGNDRLLVGSMVDYFTANTGPGDDMVEVPSYLYGVDGAVINTESGHDTVQLIYGYNNTYNLGSGNDIVIGLRDKPAQYQRIDGGLGNDTLQLLGNRADYTLRDNGNGTYAITKTDVSIEIKSVEKLVFDDQEIYVTNQGKGVIAYNIANAAGGETVAASVDAAQGSVVVDDVIGAVIFTPANNFVGDATVTVELSDAGGVIDSQTSVVTVTGTPANNTGSDYAILVETDVALTASGALPAGTYNATTIPGQLGELAVDAAGNWMFTASSAMNYLPEGGVVTESFIATTTGGIESPVAISIIGSDDASTFVADATAATSAGSGSSSYTEPTAQNYINGASNTPYELLIGTASNDKVVMNSGDSKYVDVMDGHDDVFVNNSNGHTVRTGSGNDKISIGLYSHHYSIDSGAGDDNIIQASSLYTIKNVTINAGSGHDLVSLLAGENVHYLLGSGNDVITRTATTQSTYQFVDGGAGNDVLVMNGNYADYTLVDNGQGSYYLKNVAGVAVSIELQGVESIAFNDQTVPLTVAARADIDYTAVDVDGSVTIDASVDAAEGSVYVNAVKGRIEFRPSQTFSGSTTVTSYMIDAYGVAGSQATVINGQPSDPIAATMLSPLDGATFTSSSQVFSWTGFAVDEYRLSVGTTLDGNDIYEYQGTNNNATATGLPTDGSQVYVRLSSYISGAWQDAYYQYTAHTQVVGVPAEIVYPENGKTFTSDSHSFSWTDGVAVDEYRLSVGSTLDGNDIYEIQGTFTSDIVNVLPVDGSIIYVRLSSRIGGEWQSNYYEYTAFTDVPAEPSIITSPVDGSTLLGTSQPFRWSKGAHVRQYRISVGSTLGGNDIYEHQGLGSWVMVEGLPVDGSQVYVRMSSDIDGIWHHEYYQYTAYMGMVLDQPAQMITPINGSTLGNTVKQNFAWDYGVGGDRYRLSLGTGPGANDLYYYEGVATFVQPTGLPKDGSTIYARLSSRIDGSWVDVFYEFTAYLDVPFVGAELLSPTPGSNLPSTSVTFTWEDVGASKYAIYVGNAQSFSDIAYETSIPGDTTSFTFNGLPSDGRTIWVRIWSQETAISGWQTNDYSFTAYEDVPPVAGVMTSPTDGATLTGATAGFYWSGINVEEYYLRVGTTGVGSENIYSASIGTNTMASVSNLPVDGSAVYVRLSSFYGGSWHHADYSYTSYTDITTPVQGAMVGPMPTSTFTTTEVIFSWSGELVEEYFLRVGTTGVGSENIHSMSHGINTTAKVNGMPSDGSTVYVRLSSYYDGSWHHADYTYTGATIVEFRAPELLSPTQGSTLTSTTLSLEWEDVNAYEYYVYVGTGGVGSLDLYSDNVGNTTSLVVDGVPNDGSTLYVRLWAKETASGINDWLYKDFFLIAADSFVISQGDIITPAPSSTLGSTSETFTWSGDNVDGYFLRVGTTAVGSEDIYSASNGVSKSAVVSGLPNDGSTVYVRLSSFYESAWHHADYTYTAYTPPLADSAANLITPSPDGVSFLNGDVFFEWEDVGANEYAIAVSGGTSLPQIPNLDATKTTNTSVTTAVSDGSIVTPFGLLIRLYSRFGSEWVYRDYNNFMTNGLPIDMVVVQ